MAGQADDAAAWQQEQEVAALLREIAEAEDEISALLSSQAQHSAEIDSGKQRLETQASKGQRGSSGARAFRRCGLCTALCSCAAPSNGTSSPSLALA